MESDSEDEVLQAYVSFDYESGSSQPETEEEISTEVEYYDFPQDPYPGDPDAIIPGQMDYQDIVANGWNEINGLWTHPDWVWTGNEWVRRLAEPNVNSATEVVVPLEQDDIDAIWAVPPLVVENDEYPEEEAYPILDVDELCEECHHINEYTDTGLYNLLSKLHYSFPDDVEIFESYVGEWKKSNLSRICRYLQIINRCPT